jgi:hypothetical protein
MLLVTAFVSYVGCFTKRYRLELLEKTWVPFLKKINVRVLCPAPSLEGNTPSVAHGVPQVNPENVGPLWQFDLTCVGKPSGKTTHKGGGGAEIRTHS